MDAFSAVLQKVEDLEAAVQAQRETVALLLGAAKAVNTSIAAVDEKTQGTLVAVNALGMVMRAYAEAERARQASLDARLRAVEARLGMSGGEPSGAAR